jgi:DNA-binding NarL/FixJ family response regulator
MGCDRIELLTGREREVLAMLSRGMATKTIASDLEISPQTVKTHARTIYRKLGVTNRVQAVLLYQESSSETED